MSGLETATRTFEFQTAAILHGAITSIVAKAPTIASPTPPTGWKPCGTVRHDLASGSMEWVQATLNKLGLMATPMPVTGMDDAATQQGVPA